MGMVLRATDGHGFGGPDGPFFLLELCSEIITNCS